MFGLLATVNTLYLSLNAINPAGDWATVPAAALLGIAPLAVALSVIRKFNPRLRWILVSLYLTLSLFILLEQHHSPNGMGLAGDALIFTVYFGCCVHFWYSYRRGTAGAFVTIAGFAGWAAVFVVSPVMDLYWPSVPIENEVWNLPKYVVAVGMILLLLEDQIEHTKYLALHDHLTGLANRRLFQEQLESALNRARRAGTQMALLVVDLDQFKQVNDTLGHHVGDMVLKRVAELFMARVRHTDTVARTGGDEFSIILAEPTSRERATAVVRSLLQIIAEPIQLGDGHSAKIGASVGMAVFPDDAKDLQTLCIEADLRMYDSKYDATEDHGHTIDSRETGSQEQARGAGTLRRATDR